MMMPLEGLSIPRKGHEQSHLELTGTYHTLKNANRRRQMGPGPAHDKTPISIGFSGVDRLRNWIPAYAGMTDSPW